MEWMFLVTASHRTRVESRVLQVLEHHMVSLQSFSSVRVAGQIRVTFIAEIDNAGAVRTSDLLRKLQDVQSVDSFVHNDGLCRTLALFKVLCDHESRLPLLQVISSLGAQVVAVRPDWVTFQIVGTLQDIEGLHASLLPYGLVEAMSVASAVAKRESTAQAAEEWHVAPLPAPQLLKQPRKQQTVVFKRATV